MYSKETIKKVAFNYHSYMELIKSGLIIPRVHISKGNRKIGRVLNVSTVPIMDCKNCKECKNICYAVNSYIMHTTLCPTIRKIRVMRIVPVQKMGLLGSSAPVLRPFCDFFGQRPSSAENVSVSSALLSASIGSGAGSSATTACA